MLSSSSGHGASLLSLHEASHAHLHKFIDEQRDELELIFALEADLAIWLTVLSERPEVGQYRSAHRDLGLALYSIAAGLYRQAFGELRSFVEVSFGALHLSSSELERRKWVSGRRDLSWREITSSDTGLYAPTYLQEFMPDAIDDGVSLLEKLRASYRRSSEYLHGNVATTALLPAEISYVSEPILEWKTAAEAALFALHHSLFVRYYADLPLRGKQSVESLLEQHLSHLPSVRRALGLPEEEL